MQRFVTSKPVEARQEDGVTVLSGYAAVFYDPTDAGTEFELFDGFVERILPGAFSAAMVHDDVRALFNHSPDMILGRNKAGTLRLKEDNVGLLYEIDLPPTQVGRDVAASVDRGDVTGSSFAFQIQEQNRRTTNAGIDVRELCQVSLFDVGPCSFPAYSSTSVSARTGQTDGEVIAIKAELESRKKTRESVRRRLMLIEKGLT